MKKIAIAAAVLVLIVGVGALGLSRVWADGISPTPLHYSGVLEEEGTAVDGSRSFEVELWDDPADVDQSHRVCTTRRDDVQVVAGRFRIELDAGCTEAIQANPDLWVELRVEGEPLGRMKLGAVPYAVEAGRAAEASGALRERLDSMVPPGTIVAFGGERAPTGWLLCDGSEVERARYSALFAAIGTAHGAGDGATTFQLPDYRGRFLRGVDGAAERDAEHDARGAAGEGGNTGNAVGSVQGFATAMPRAPFATDAAGNHTHDYERPNGSEWTDTSGSGFAAQNETVPVATSAAGDHTHALSGGDPETRPDNAAVHFVIRY